MKLSKTFRRAAVGTMLGAAAIGVSTEALAAFQAHISIKGKTQGQFKSESRDKRKDKWMPVITFSYGVKAPRDAQTGQSTGRRTNDPLCFTKEWGAASPQIANAMSKNEVLSEVSFEFTKTDANGAEYVYHTIKLTDATVTSLRQMVGRPDQGRTATHEALTADQFAYEEVCFSFRKIEIENKDGKTIHSDDWGQPHP